MTVLDIRVHVGHGTCRSGSVAVTTNPPEGPGPAVNDPPNATARARMPAMPFPDSPGGGLVAPPRPDAPPAVAGPALADVAGRVAVDAAARNASAAGARDPPDACAAGCAAAPIHPGAPRPSSATRTTSAIGWYVIVMLACAPSPACRRTFVRDS